MMVLTARRKLEAINFDLGAPMSDRNIDKWRWYDSSENGGGGDDDCCDLAVAVLDAVGPLFRNDAKSFTCCNPSVDKGAS